ncbi:MAG: DUF72 domain-containing protein [Candidatus Bathyarchaeia archaeon]
MVYLDIYVGTSGWMYSWNESGSLDWYVTNSGLNAVELNASFYRFPFPNAVRSWSVKGGKLRWAIKVNRLITHVFKFNEKALGTWRRFEEIFKPMNHIIDFYLFQLPPSIKVSYISRIETFINAANLGEKFALEPRNITWFGSDDVVRWASDLGITLVSVDCPDLPLEIFNTNGIVYLRMHGRAAWYSHNYTCGEMEEIKKRVLEVNPKAVYIFFNNDTNMLHNAQEMLKLFREKI